MSKFLKKSKNPSKRARGQEGSSSIPPPSNLYFRDGKREEKYIKDFMGRTIVYGKVIRFPFFEREHLNSAHMFEILGLKSFLEPSLPMYPILVKHFYTNLEYHPENRSISSYVKGKTINLNVPTIRHILSLPDGDIQVVPSNQFVDWVDEFVPADAILQMTNGQPPLHGHLTPSYNQLGVECRIIHKIITFCITPRFGSHSCITCFDVFLIWCVLNGRKFDLAVIILNYFRMLTENKTEKSSLGYGMILTKIFEKAEVDFEGEEVRPFNHYDMFDARQLHLMGFKKRRHDGKWVLANEANDPPPVEREDVDIDDEIEVDDEGHASIPTNIPPSFHQTPPQTSHPHFPNEQYFQNLQTHMDNQFLQIQQGFSSFREHIDERISSHFIHFDSRFDNFQSEVRNRLNQFETHYDERMNMSQASLDSINHHFSNMSFGGGAPSHSSPPDDDDQD